MSLSILIDMNLSPDWCEALIAQGWQAIHWSTIGNPRATDKEIMDWARAHGFVVFTHDLDFGTMLALNHATGPSVPQVRSQNILPDRLASIVLAALNQHESDLKSGALVVVDASKSRVRILPI